MKLDKYMDRLLYYGGLQKSGSLIAIDLIKKCIRELMKY